MYCNIYISTKESVVRKWSIVYERIKVLDSLNLIPNIITKTIVKKFGSFCCVHLPTTWVHWAALTNWLKHAVNFDSRPFIMNHVTIFFLLIGGLLALQKSETIWRKAKQNQNTFHCKEEACEKESSLVPFYFWKFPFLRSSNLPFGSTEFPRI